MAIDDLGSQESANPKEGGVNPPPVTSPDIGSIESSSSIYRDKTHLAMRGKPHYPKELTLRNYGELIDVCLSKIILNQQHFTRKELTTVAVHAIIHALRETDAQCNYAFLVDHVDMCLEALTAAEWQNDSFKEHDLQIIRFCFEGHRTNKGRIPSHAWRNRKPEHKERQELAFSRWTSEKGVPGTTHSDRVLASTLYLAPWAYSFVEKMPPENRMKAMQSVTGRLNILLWEYDPRDDDGQFTKSATWVLNHSSNSSKRSGKRHLGKQQQDNPLAQETPAVLERTEPPIRDISNPTQTTSIVRDEVINTVNAAPEPEIKKEKPVVPLSPQEIAESMRKVRVIEYVQKQVEGAGNCWDYDEAVVLLVESHTNIAKSFLHGTVKKLTQKPPKNSSVERAAPELIRNSVSSFNPPNGDSAYFKGHLQKYIADNGVQIYNKH